MTLVVDTHCHLDLDTFQDDLDAVLERANNARVQAIVLIGFNPERWLSTERLSIAQPGFVRAVGVHPNDTHLWSGSTAKSLTSEAQKSDVVAIGEIGLDLYRRPEDEEIQLLAFREQLQIAARLNLPVVIHQRSAEQQTIEALSEQVAPGGIMHCFSGDAAYASQCLDLGFYLGIGGIVTFNNAEDVREAVRQTSIDKILVETDAPFLAPTPWRGKRNEPAYIRSVISTIAELKGISEHEVERRTTENAISVFGSRLAKSIEEAQENPV